MWGKCNSNTVDTLSNEQTESMWLHLDLDKNNDCW